MSDIHTTNNFLAGFFVGDGFLFSIFCSSPPPFASRAFQQQQQTLLINTSITPYLFTSSVLMSLNSMLGDSAEATAAVSPESSDDTTTATTSTANYLVKQPATSAAAERPAAICSAWQSWSKSARSETKRKRSNLMDDSIDVEAEQHMKADPDEQVVYLRPSRRIKFSSSSSTSSETSTNAGRKRNPSNDVSLL